MTVTSDPVEVGTRVAVKEPWIVPIPSKPPGSGPSVAGIAVKRTLKAPALPDWDRVGDVRFPEELLTVDVAAVNAFCRNTDKFVIAGTCPRPFERLQFYRNSENLYTDLGEARRVVIVSTTEGEDKPLKYPNMFMSSQLCIINKTDLLPYLDISVEKLKEYALAVNNKLEFIELSVKTGEGMEQWYAWLKKNR